MPFYFTSYFIYFTICHINFTSCLAISRFAFTLNEFLFCFRNCHVMSRVAIFFYFSFIFIYSRPFFTTSLIRHGKKTFYQTKNLQKSAKATLISYMFLTTFMYSHHFIFQKPSPPKVNLPQFCVFCGFNCSNLYIKQLKVQKHFYLISWRDRGSIVV